MSLIMSPGGQQSVGKTVRVGDRDPVPVGIEVDGLWVAVADLEGGGGFVGIGEPVQLGEPDRRVGALEVREDGRSLPLGGAKQRAILACSC